MYIKIFYMSNVPKSDQITVTCIYVYTYMYVDIYVYGKYIYYRPAMLRATLSKFQLNERVNK